MVTWVYNAYDGVKDDSIIHDGHGYELVRRIYAKEDRWTIIGLTQGHDASIYLAPRAPGEGRCLGECTTDIVESERPIFYIQRISWSPRLFFFTKL